MKKKLAGLAALALPFVVVAVASAQVATSTFTGAIDTTKSDVSTVAAYAITAVLGFVGLLIAGGWAWRFLKRHIGKRI